MDLQFSCCCNGCQAGNVIDRFGNVTRVRPYADPLGPNYTALPYGRQDAGEFAIENGASCASLEPAGYCGTWIRLPGDLNGLSDQVINDTVNDIMTCAGVDADHFTVDHNCYMRLPTATAGDFEINKQYQIATIGSTDFTLIGALANTVGKVFTATGAGIGTGTAKPVVDGRQYLFGGQWVHTKNFWQGSLGFRDRNDPHYLTGGSCTTGRLDAGGGVWSTTFSDDAGAQPEPPQTRYLQIWGRSDFNTHNIPAVGAEYDTTTNIEGTSLVNKLSGMLTTSFSSDISPLGSVDPNPNAFGDGDWNSQKGQFFSFVSIATRSDSHVELNSGAYELWDTDSGAGIDNLLESVVPGVSRTMYLNRFVGGVWVRETLQTETLTISNTSATYERYAYYMHEIDGDTGTNFIDHETRQAIYSVPYTASDCNADMIKLMLAANMSDVNLLQLRRDGDFAHAALMMYDGIGPIVPALQAPLPQTSLTMNDYSTAQHMDGSWDQIAWEDPNSYVWKGPDGGFSSFPAAAGGNVIHRGMRTGEIVSFSRAGADSHFWFGDRKLKSSGGGWVVDRYGAYKPVSVVPDTALRWLDDSVIYGGGGNVGVFAHGWWDQRGAVVTGGKFLRFPGKWNGTNAGRPCGWDKYAIDQQSVCCYVAGVVTPSGNAANPLATHGLAVGDYVVIESDGVYHITGIADNGDGTWTVSTGAKIDDLPTGFTFIDPEVTGDGALHIGRLRWPTSPGICGRVPVTATWAAGILTIASATALPTLRDIIGAGISVDLRDAAYVSAIAGAALTRVDDNHWTTPMVSAPSFTVAWMTSHGVDYEKFSSESRKTAVYLIWTFDYRGALKAIPPTWYAGIVGITSCTVSQFTYPNFCSAVGIVPNNPDTGSPVETFPGQVMFPFPATVIYDSINGAHHSAEIHCTMPDPFWQEPFRPNCGGSGPGTWKEDIGDGTGDFPHHPIVEAMSSVPAGMTLPADVKLMFDPTNTFTPSYYAGGISSGSPNDEALADWVFAVLACQNINTSGPFSAKYSKFVDCTPVNWVAP